MIFLPFSFHSLKTRSCLHSYVMVCCRSLSISRSTHCNNFILLLTERCRLSKQNYGWFTPWLIKLCSQIESYNISFRRHLTVVLSRWETSLSYFLLCPPHRAVMMTSMNGVEWNCCPHNITAVCGLSCPCSACALASPSQYTVRETYLRARHHQVWYIYRYVIITELLGCFQPLMGTRLTTREML